MSVTFNDDAGKQALAEGARRLQRTAQFFQDQLIRRLSVSNPRPYLNSSKPGEYPRKRTGNAIANVLWGPTDPAGIISGGMKVRAGVGQPGKYLAILEFFKNRLGFLATLNELKPLLQAKLTGKAP